MRSNIPAFPMIYDRRPEEDFGLQEGMTLRDWFAGMALNKLIEMEYPRKPSILAERCYVYADAMIAEQSKGVDSE